MMPEQAIKGIRERFGATFAEDVSRMDDHDLRCLTRLVQPLLAALQDEPACFYCGGGVDPEGEHTPHTCGPCHRFVMRKGPDAVIPWVVRS